MYTKHLAPGVVPSRWWLILLITAKLQWWPHVLFFPLYRWGKRLWVVVKSVMQGHKEDKRQGLDLNLGCSKFMPLSPEVPGTNPTSWPHKTDKEGTWDLQAVIKQEPPDSWNHSWCHVQPHELERPSPFSLTLRENRNWLWGWSSPVTYFNVTRK